MNWQNSFVGRAGDLKVLQDAYKEVRSGGTRVVAIVSESGFGKTRLAQEFYNWLSHKHDGVGGDGYWPDRLLREADNLRVNPDLADCGGIGKKMPFLWWGLRLADPGQRNVTSASGVLPAGIETLRAHLSGYMREMKQAELRKNQLLGGGNATVDVGISVGETALDVLGNAATFGLLGIAKAVGQATWEHRKASKEIAGLDSLDARPAAAEGRARDTLAETVVGDLFHLCKAPPKGFEPIPLVILVDDAHWLETDGGMGSFLDILLGRARAENWPLLLLLTCWRREWRVSAAAGEGPGKFSLTTAGDFVHDLSGVEGLEAIIREAFPGLPDCQVKSLTEKAEGVPRLLDEMLMYLGRRPKAFIERNMNMALSDAGLKDVLSNDFASFVADRLQDSPVHVRRALAIASTQGVRFSPRLVHRIAEKLLLADSEAGLQEGEDPHSFVTGAREKAGGEFRLRAYHAASVEDLGNLLAEPDVRKALRSALEELVEDMSTATNSELALVLDGAVLLGIEKKEWASHAIDAGAELIGRAQTAFDSRLAGTLSKRILPLISDDLLYGKREALIVACDAAVEWDGPTDTIRSALSTLVDLMRALDTEQPTPGARRELAIALGRLGDIVEALDGPAAARPLREEDERISRALATEQPTPGARRDLAIALARLGGIVEALDGPAAARPLREEMVDIMRALATEQPRRSIISDLFFVLNILLATVENLNDQHASNALKTEIAKWLQALQKN